MLSNSLLESMLCKAVEDTPTRKARKQKPTTYLLKHDFLKVLTFLLTKRKAKNNDGDMVEWVCMVPEKIKRHLRSKGVKIETDIFEKIKSIHSRKIKKSAPHLFLSEASSLTAIPAGLKWRHSIECEYTRCLMLEASALSPPTLKTLDRGIL